jgi:hypothetical protein
VEDTAASGGYWLACTGKQIFASRYVLIYIFKKVYFLGSSYFYIPISEREKRSLKR